MFGKDGGSLPGATVKVVNGSVGTITDVSGRFELNGLKAGKTTLAVSFVGYETETVTTAVPQKPEVKITLKPVTLTMDEVLVSGVRITSYNVCYTKLLR